MAELDLQKLMAEATQQRSSITTALLAIQKSLDRMQPTVTKREPVLASLEPAVNELPAWRPGVDTAVGKLQTDTGDILAHLAKIATRSFPTGSSSTMLPTTCSTGFPSRDASASVSALTSPAAPSSFTSTNDVVSELAAPVVSDEALVVEASVVAALTPTRCSTGDLDHKTDKDDSKALCLLPWSVPTLFTIPQEASPPQSFQLFVAIELDIKVPTRCSTMCFTEDTTVCTYLFMADVTQSSRRQRQMLRPIPWPSFTCHSRVGHPMKPCSATQVLRWALQLAASSHIPVTLGSMQDNFHLPLPFCLQFVQQINADFEAPLCWERHRGIFQHGVAPSLPRTDLLQENLNENPKYSIRITSCESGYKLLHTSLLLLWIRAVCVFLCCSVQFQWKVAWLVYHLSNRCPVALVRLPMPANYFTSIWIYAVHKEVLILRLYCCSTTKSEGMQANLATSWTEIKPRSHFCIVPISGLNQEFHLESLCNPGASWYGMCTNFQAEKIQNWMVSVIELSSVYLKRPLLIRGSDASIMLEGLPGPNLHMSLKILNAAHGGISLIYFMGDIKYNYEKLSGAPLYCSEQLQWEIAWQSFVPVITSRKCISYIETITRSFYTTWAPLQFLQFVSILVHVSDWFGSLQLQKLWNPSYTWSESTWRLHQLRRLLGHMNTWWVCIYGQQSYARPVGRPRPIQDLQIKQGVGGSIYHLVSHKYDCLVHKEKTRTKNQVSLLELSELTLFTSVGNAEVQGTMLFTDTSLYWQFLRKEEFEGSGIYSSDGMTVPQSAKGILGSELMGSYQVSQFRRTVLVGLQWSTYCLFSGTRSLWQQENAQTCHMILFGSIANSRSCASFPGSKYTVADNLTTHPVGELVSLKLIQVGFVTLLGSDSSSGRHLEQLWDPGGNTSSFCPPPSSEEIASYQGIWMGGRHSVDAIELPSSCEPDPFQGERRIMVPAFVAHHYCLNAFLDKIHFVHAYFQVQVCTGHDNLKDYLDFDQVLFNKDYYLNDATVFDLDRFYLDTFLGQVCIDHDFYLVEVSLDYSYHRNYDQAKHQVQWDPSGSQWSRHPKPNFKEGGMSRELLPLVHQEKPKACPQGPSGE